MTTGCTLESWLIKAGPALEKGSVIVTNVFATSQRQLKRRKRNCNVAFANAKFWRRKCIGNIFLISYAISRLGVRQFYHINDPPINQSYIDCNTDTLMTVMLHLEEIPPENNYPAASIKGRLVVD